VRKNRNYFTFEILSVEIHLRRGKHKNNKQVKTRAKKRTELSVPFHTTLDESSVGPCLLHRLFIFFLRAKSD